MSISGRRRSHGDDKKLLVLEGGDKGILVVVINYGDKDATRELIATPFPGEGCDCVSPGIKESSGDMRSNGASGLGLLFSTVVYEA